MNRRTFLTTTASLATASAQTSRRSNVLLLIADDLGRHTGAYGDTIAVTPNLDRLAREGVRFTNAFCTTASCSASRSVIHSGLHNHANGQYGHAHAEHNFSYLPHVRPISSLLRDNGFRTGVIGKLHVNPIERFRFDLVSEGRNRDVSNMAERARKFMQDAAGAPWFLQMGYADPHRADRGFANRAYPGVKRAQFDPAQVRVPPFLPDNEATRREVAEYYQASNRLDQGIGLMLDLLRETNQLDNTLVIFMSDNGMPFPNAKTNAYDAGLHLPLLVRSPGQARRGLVNNAMISWVDIAPTILDWAGAKLPPYPLHGRSFLPILEQENPSGWDRVYLSHTFHEVTMYYPVRGVRTRQYKYMRNLFPELSFPFSTDLFGSETWQSIRKGGPNARVGRRPVEQYLHRAPEELYDITSDPDELNNLARAPQHQAVLGELRADVTAMRRKTNDPWLINDSYQ
ncbi:MAG TPA: sulfatase [Bryobacteraceae bacterium]|nr:sulfatase [Bryobacteraceae bacterium]